MNKLNLDKTYSWDDQIKITLSNGKTFKMKLSDNKKATYMGYMCQSCGGETTLAQGNCGLCGNPFEPKDVREAKSMFPEIKVQIEDPNRLVWYMTHRNWLCLQCESYNANLPRNDIHSTEISCINCGHGYEAEIDLLFEDTLASTPSSSAQQFKDSILDVIDKHRNPPNGSHPQNIPHDGQQDQGGSNGRDFTKSNTEINSPLWRNKSKILFSVFGVMGISYIIHYGFIEKVDYNIEVIDHQWTTTQYLEEYRQQTDDAWKKDVHRNNYNDFVLIRRSQREASWDPYIVVTGTQQVKDRSNCLTYDNPEKICKPQPEKCDYATVNGITVKGNCYTPAPSCYTPTKTCKMYGTKPEDITETRYHKHPYIYFSYMDWEIISNPLIETGGLDDEVIWKFSSSHHDVKTNKLLRYTNNSEKYTIRLDIEGGESQNISLPKNTWANIEHGLQCSIQGTRLGGINRTDFREVIDSCK